MKGGTRRRDTLEFCLGCGCFNFKSIKSNKQKRLRKSSAEAKILFASDELLLYARQFLQHQGYELPTTTYITKLIINSHVEECKREFG